MKHSKNIYRTGLLAATLCLLLLSCSPNKWVMGKVVSGLTAGGSSLAFTGEDDPQLVAESLPLLIKTHELLLEKQPDNPELLLATASTICMYAYAFIQLPSEMLPDDQEIKRVKQMARAKKLFLRSRKYLFRAMDIRHPGFSKLMLQNKTKEAVSMTTPADSSYLYWTGVSWMSAIVADKSDMSLIIDIPKAAALMKRLLEMAETYDKGAVHEFFISYYGGLSAAMGGNKEKARHHYQRAHEISNYSKVGPYISLATTICVTNQNDAEYRQLLKKALKINLDRDPSQRLVNTLYREKAQWLLDNIGNYFLLDEENEE